MHVQAIAIAMSDGGLVTVTCLEEDDWEETAKTLSADGCECDGVLSILACTVALPDGVSTAGVR
jgi:hypothetical protein